MLPYGLGRGLSVQELFAESLPVLVIAALLNDNLLEVIGQLKDDELVLLAELEVIPCSDALLVHGCSVSFVSPNQSLAA